MELTLGQVLKKGLERREREEGNDGDPSWLAERELRWAGVEGCLDDDGEHRAHLQFNKAAGAGFTTTQKTGSRARRSRDDTYCYDRAQDVEWSWTVVLLAIKEEASVWGRVALRGCGINNGNHDRQVRDSYPHQKPNLKE